MKSRCLLALLLVGVIGAGCEPICLKKPYPRAIDIKHQHTKYERGERFWAGEIGDVQGFVLPMAVISKKKNAVIETATKGQYTFFVVAMHDTKSNEALKAEILKPVIELYVQNKPVKNVDALAACGPMVNSRIEELTAEKNRLNRELVAAEGAAPPAKGLKAIFKPKPDPKVVELRGKLSQTEHELETLSSVRAYLSLGRTDTRRGAVWFVITATPGKQDVASIQHLQWTYGQPPMMDMQEYGYKFEQLDKLKLKQVGQRQLPGCFPGFMKRWFEK